MNVERNSNRGLVLRWVLLCGLGLGAGLAAGLGLAGPIEALVGMMLVTPIILGIAGLMFGAIQWVAIWTDLRAGARWAAASALGLGSGMTVGVIAVEVLGRAITGDQVRLVALSPAGRVAGLALVGTVTGLTVGVAQRLALGSATPAAWRWVAWCVLGFGAGLPAGSLAADLLLGGLDSVAGFATFLGVAGLAVGALTVRGAARIVIPHSIGTGGKTTDSVA